MTVEAAGQSVPVAPAPERSPVRLAVVGGGITGLAAAWEGLQQGAQVVVLEAGDRLGGKIRTERVDGRVIEHGPDSFVAYRPAALALVRELGLEDEVVSTRGTREVYLHRAGRMHPVPDGMGMVLPTKLWPFLTTGTLTPWDKLRAAFDLVMPRLLGDEDVAIGAFVGRRLGRGIVTKFADPMMGGIYGTSVDELSLDAVLPSLRTNEREHRSLMLASLAQGRSRRAAPGAGSPFRTLHGGLGDLVDRLVAELVRHGADLRTGVAVSALDEHPDGTRVAFENGSLTVDAVVLASGPDGAARLLTNPAPKAAAALAQIPLASTTVVTLAYAATSFAAPVTSHGWLESGPAPVSGVTISSAKWEGRSPDDEVLIRAFVPERLGPLVRSGDEEILATVCAHVETALGATAGPTATWISRWHHVMPKYTVGHLGRVQAVEEALLETSWRVAGSALHGVGVPDCIADGRVQAQAALLVAHNRSTPHVRITS